jgi:phage gpG-like protein
MPLFGDFQTLKRWEKSIGQLASRGLAFDCANEMAEAHLRQVAREFETERDPFGKPWKPKKRPDGRKILRGKTGNLRRFRKATINQRGYKIGTTAPYLRFHQSGTSRMAQRRVLPGKRLPTQLASEFRSIFTKYCRQRLRLIGGGIRVSGTGSGGTRAA